MTTLPECPRPDCTLVATALNPTGHHWHTRDGIPLHHEDDFPSCEEDSDYASRCYSAHIPTEPAASLEGAPNVPSPVTYRDAETGQYVTAEHAAAHPATTVREDDSRVRELQARLDAVVALHYPADNDADRTPVCETCHGKAGVHECGCWADKDRTPVCGHCNQGWKGASVPWPCPTVNAALGVES